LTRVVHPCRLPVPQPPTLRVNLFHFLRRSFVVEPLVYLKDPCHVTFFRVILTKWIETVFFPKQILVSLWKTRLSRILGQEDGIAFLTCQLWICSFSRRNGGGCLFLQRQFFSSHVFSLFSHFLISTESRVYRFNGYVRCPISLSPVEICYHWAPFFPFFFFISPCPFFCSATPRCDFGELLRFFPPRRVPSSSPGSPRSF